jgi:hypothetical protein
MGLSEPIQTSIADCGTIAPLRPKVQIARSLGVVRLAFPEKRGHRSSDDVERE